MHIAFAGGGISRIVLADNLKEERSNSLSGSINYDKATEKWIAGFTLEAFYTKLNDAFYLEPLGEDDLGETFEKRNGSGAKVQGVTIELRANYNRLAQFEAGFTLQSSKFDEAVENIEGLGAKREFLRTPEKYGYASLSFMPSPKFNATLSSVYTGPMILAHFGGAPEQAMDEYKKSDSFTELNLKLAYTFKLNQVDAGLELFGGIKNITNTYQDDFDSGKNRDSNYVYGPGSPRTFYVGVRLKSW
jgi:outer membrane receptor for ferrienterochelin and colicins